MDSIPVKDPESGPDERAGALNPLFGRLSGFRAYVVMHFALLLYCIGVVFMKLASQHEPLSIGFMGNMLLMMPFSGSFAYIWQQVLKVIPLSTAFLSSEIGLMWMSLFGYWFFKERITVGLVCGILMILAGVYLVSREFYQEGR